MGSERYEQLIAFLSTHLPPPIEQEQLADGILVFRGGSPGEVIATLTRSSVIIEEFRMEWPTPSMPVVRPRRVGAVKWRRLPETAAMNAIEQLIKGAREVRRGRYRTCQMCGTNTPPEWLTDEDTCQTCAPPEREVVH